MNKKSFTLRSDLEKARASALASLSMREHSIKELQDKLKRKAYQSDSIDTVVQECISHNYLNDQRFAEIYWRSRAQKGYGPNKISMELKHRGISSAQISQAAEQPELDFDAVIKRVYLKKFKNTEIKDFKDKVKRQNYLYQRGFDLELIRAVME
ncbi:MAG TPA: regulatory protein RecX [Oceanospirillales bacterium]|nr:regulatory protein RecX [Oceanospirillales bacterium]